MKISENVLIFMGFVCAVLVLVICLGLWAQSTPVSYDMVYKPTGEHVLLEERIENSSEVIVLRRDGTKMAVERSDLEVK